MPNLASRSLGLALKALPEHWEAQHGDRPLMAETFTDIEQFEGTCYKASNWEPLGLTKGFERHRALSLCLSDHETGAPVAIGFAAQVSKTDENKREGEQTVALDLYAKTNLEGATITGNASPWDGADDRAKLSEGVSGFSEAEWAEFGGREAVVGTVLPRIC